MRDACIEFGRKIRTYNVFEHIFDIERVVRSLKSNK